MIAWAGEIVPDAELADGPAQTAGLDLADGVVEVFKARAAAPGQLFPDLQVDLAAIALVEEVREDRGAVDVKTAEATAGVKGAVRDIEEARQILQIVIDVWVGDFLHPGRGRFLPPDAVIALVIAELYRMVELVRDGHAQRVFALGLLVNRVGIVVVEFEITISGVAAFFGIGEAVGGAAPEVAEEDVVFVAVEAIVGRRCVITQFVDLEDPGAVEDHGGQVDIVGDAVAVEVFGRHGFGAFGVVVQQETAGERERFLLFVGSALHQFSEPSLVVCAELRYGVYGLYQLWGAAQGASMRLAIGRGEDVGGAQALDLID